jgi:hypothetical protein
MIKFLFIFFNQASVVADTKNKATKATAKQTVGKLSKKDLEEMNVRHRLFSFFLFDLRAYFS